MSTILALTAVIIVPIAIVAFLPKNKGFFERNRVKGFGLGVYLMLVAVLLYEGIKEGSTTAGFVWFIVGLSLSFAIGLTLKEFHHHHSEEERATSHTRASTWRILISDFFHNIVDGLGVIAGFAISPTVGIVSFLGVLGHQIIQQIGQQILLVGSGTEAKKAVWISLVVALSIFIGFWIEESVEALLLAFSAGVVAWKVWVDVTHTQWNKEVASGFILGSLLLAIILLSVPHFH